MLRPAGDWRIPRIPRFLVGAEYPGEWVQEFWLTLRAEAQPRRDTADAKGEDATGYDELIAELDTEITRTGNSGKVTSPATTATASSAAAVPGPPAARQRHGEPG